MAVESVTKRVNAMGIGSMSKVQLRALLVNLVDVLQAMAAKLDADAGVTDTNYAALVATYLED